MDRLAGQDDLIGAFHLCALSLLASAPGTALAKQSGIWRNKKVMSIALATLTAKTHKAAVIYSCQMQDHKNSVNPAGKH
jgi:hypothetical protein